MYFKRVFKRCLVLLVSGLFAGTALAIPDDKATVDVVESEWEGEVTLTIPMILLGDVNGDNNINETDLNMIVSHIMGNTPEGFIEDAADINVDGFINAADVVLLVNAVRLAK